jgi:biotin carboxyl carrier protein
MNIALSRLDPIVPDPVESRRHAAGRLVRVAYATAVFGVLAFFIIYFGAPLVFLRGPGTVSSPRYVISLPYTVHVNRMTVVPGEEVRTGEEIGQVRSPQVDGIIATYMRAQADIASRQAELRVKARVARDSLEAARSYLKVAEDAVIRMEAANEQRVASMTLLIDVFRQRALARKDVVSQEAEAAEAAVQLASLDQFAKELRDRVVAVERSFAEGRLFAPTTGIVSTSLARVGQSIVAGTAVAEILDPTDVFVDWYIPNERLFDPRVGNVVLVLFGNRRIPGKITEILPVSEVYAGGQAVLARDRQATQIARIRFDPGATPPALNSTVFVHMHYSNLSMHIANGLIRLFGLY